MEKRAPHQSYLLFVFICLLICDRFVQKMGALWKFCCCRNLWQYCWQFAMPHRTPHVLWRLNSSGNFAIFAAIRRASSLVSNFIC